MLLGYWLCEILGLVVGLQLNADFPGAGLFSLLQKNNHFDR